MTFWETVLPVLTLSCRVKSILYYFYEEHGNTHQLKLSFFLFFSFCGGVRQQWRQQHGAAWGGEKGIKKWNNDESSCLCKLQAITSNNHTHVEYICPRSLPALRKRVYSLLLLFGINLMFPKPGIISVSSISGRERSVATAIE